MSLLTSTANISAWYLVSVCGGNVIEHYTDRAKLTTADQKPTQLWRIHRQENVGAADQFSFENVSTGKYLRAQSAGGQAAVINGEVQWWTLEKAPVPGGVYIKCVEYDDTYLCNFVGSFNEGNPAEVWSRDRGWIRAAAWYIRATTEAAAIEVHDIGRTLVESEVGK